MLLPADFISYTREMMGNALFERLLEGLSSSPVTSIRHHPLKVSQIVSEDEQSPISFPADDPVPWCEGGYYLSTRPNFTFDPLLHAGAYYVQEAASMFIDHVVRQHIQQPILMLDLCAAPGGKSTALRAALPAGSMLVSNEVVRQRANILMENMQKWGHPDVMVTQAPPADYRRSKLIFDAILTDVPCSGEGMFRKDSGAISEWSTQNVIHCQRLQREIVADAWACLRPGGLLIYSTCTLNTKENEENIAWMMEELGAEVVKTEIDERWGITGSLLPSLDVPVYRFIPGISRGEGLFMAVLRKNGESISILDDSHDKKNRKNKKSAFQRSSGNKGVQALPVTEWLFDKESFAYIQQGEIIRAIPRKWQHIYDKLIGLRVLHAGVEMATVRGRDFVPCHALALSSALRRGAFEEYAASYDEAIRYLRREAITLPVTTPRGFVLLTYKNLPLGFMKHLGTRSNNLYPQEWRIMSQMKEG